MRKNNYLCLMKQITVEGAYTRAAALCSRSEHAISDIYTKLVTWGLAPSQARGIIDRLVSENFINEQRYAHAFAHDKHAYNGWGRIKIAYQLRGKGISQQDIDDAMADIDEDMYRAALIKMLQGKWREVSGREPQLARAAMLRFAASRGYEPSLIYDAVDQVINEARED